MMRKSMTFMVQAAASMLLLAGCWFPTAIRVPPSCSTSEVKDGLGVQPGFGMIRTFTTDATGVAFVSDYHQIRRVTPEGQVTTMTVSPAFPPGTALFGLTAGPGGYLYAIQYARREILKISTSGEVSVLAGAPYEADEYTTNGWVDGQGTAARFAPMTDLCVDAQGNVFVADTFNHRIRKVTPNGTVTTIAGSGSLGNSRRSEGPLEGPALSAQFRFPRAITVGDDGTLFVSDTDNNRIAKLTPDGQVKTVYTRTEEFNRIGDVIVEPGGNVLFTEWKRVRRLSPAGEAPTVVEIPEAVLGVISLSVTPDGSILAADPYRLFKVPKAGGAASVLAGYAIECPPI